MKNKAENMDDFPQEVLEQARTIPAYQQDHPDISEVQAFAVDDPGVLDPEDAVSVEPGKTVHRIGVHISLVSWFIKPDTEIDKHAGLKAVSTYVPGRPVYMFPPDLISERLSLRDDRPSPVLSVFVDLDDDGRVHGLNMGIYSLRLSQKLTYQELSKALRKDPKIRQLYALSISLQEQRHLAGGKLIPIPYLKVRLEHDKLITEKVDPNAPEQLTITEPMILYNHMIARFLASKGVPAAFKFQAEPHGKPPSPDNPLYPVKALYALKRSHLSSRPRPHLGLGFKSYAQATSPIRRFTDLINQRQVRALLTDEDPVYTEEQLDILLPQLEEVEREVRKEQREAIKEMVLKHLEGKVIRAFISSKRKGGSVLLRDYLIQVPLSRFPDGFKEGYRLNVRIRGGVAEPQTRE